MNRMSKFIYGLAWPFFTLVHPGKVIGRENIPEGGALVCANHTRNSDPLYVYFAFGRNAGMKVMAKHEITGWPVVGTILKKCDILIWVKRGAADIAAVKAALKSLKEQSKLLIFPEGTRHEETGEGKTGAAMIAIRSGVPIVPVFVPAKKRWFARTPVVIGEPYLPFHEDRKPTIEDYRKATEELMGKIAALEEQTHGH